LNLFNSITTVIDIYLIVIIKGICPKLKGDDVMSRRDGTGPTGMGPKTGRGLGLCNVAKGAAVVRGLGLKMGLGTKRGLGNPNNPDNKK
jgi:hypothetical protein